MKQQAGYQCEPQMAVTEDGFTEWVCPVPTGYLMQCCDCSLIHEVESRVAKYDPRPSEEFEVAKDIDLQVQWRMKRRDDLAPTPKMTSDEALIRQLVDAADPVSGFGRVGSRDVEQAALRQAIAAGRARLEGKP